MSDIDEEEERDAKIRESFQLLTQGVEMVHFQVARRGVSKSCKSKKIVWLVVEYVEIDDLFMLFRTQIICAFVWTNFDHRIV